MQSNIKTMEKERLFKYAVLWHPTTAESKEGVTSKLIVEPTFVLSKDEKSLQLKAAMDIPQEYKTQLNQIEIVTRPFNRSRPQEYLGRTCR